MQLMGRTQGKARGWFRWRSRSCVPAGTSLAARQGLYRLVRYRDDVCIVCAHRTVTGARARVVPRAAAPPSAIDPSRRDADTR